MSILIESDRLVIRNFKLTDAPAYHQMTRDKDIQVYVPYACEETYEETYSTIRDYYSINDYEYDYYLVIEEKQSGKLVGAIIATALTTSPLNLDVCILTDKSMRRKGFMYEALCAFKDAVPKGTTLLFAIAQGNVASYRTVSKLVGIKNTPFPGELGEMMHHLALTT